MRLLLDTHALLWALEASPKLSPKATQAIAESDDGILVSAASIMEIALKHRLGKLPDAARLVANWQVVFGNLAAEPLSVSVEHAALAGSLDIPHKDPFDRLLIAQARIEGVPIVSNEKLFDAFGVARIW
ncbi:type II toxin-antitoxin system VapC family toxin [Sphingomonas sp. LY54]|uniref:type II toxin-antitoxin system VapC family toxin n=1 Tax=Sphingomonas sp. LY54 TaxID=3095343 RepID=UPI002D780330|nr:type II toxin-antitoxin system VapC family toxin [Sphingomonas sp. LY54]WRP27875.1 type II toxin-antitoxin system VapC family toxin [Sphingomonas sp. LY54]